MKTILHILKSSSKWWCYVYRRKFSKMFIVLRYDPLILSRISQVITSTSISGNQMIFIWMHDSVHFSSVTQSCPTLCVPMDCSTPGLLVHHPLLEPTQPHVHWVSDAIQPSHPLLSPSPAGFNLSQHRIFSNESLLHIRWPKYWSFSFNISPANEYSGSSVLPMNIQAWLPLGLTGLISLQSKRLSRVSSNTTVQKHQFFGAQLSSEPSSHIQTWLTGKA